MRIYLSFLTIQLIWVSNLLAMDAFLDSKLNSDLRDAHEAYIVRDFKRMALRLRSLFENGADEYSKNNGLELLDRAQGLLGSRPLPVDWSLPAEIKRMELVLSTSMAPEGTEHSISLQGLTLEEGQPVSLRFFPHNGSPLLDLEGALGQVEIKTVGHATELVHFKLSRRFTNLPSQGLYWLQMKLKNHKNIEGWALLSHRLRTQEIQYRRNNLPPKVFNPDDQTDKGSKIQITPTETKAEESELNAPVKAYLDAAERKIIEIKKGSKQSSSGSTEHSGHNVLRLNHKDIQRFGDLVIRRETSTEVYLDP